MKEIQSVSRLDNVLFYILEKSIKSYRQFAQRNINEINENITIDQWLVLKTIYDDPDMTQREIAKKVFKDYASITRIIDLLVKKGFLKRSFNHEDRRRYGLELTQLGKTTQQELIPVIMQNRKKALDGLSSEDIEILRDLLQKIVVNTTNNIHQKANQS